MRQTRSLFSIVEQLILAGAIVFLPACLGAQAAAGKPAEAPKAASQPVLRVSPACAAAEFRQFDYWVGDWDVTSTNDGIARGTSHISREMNGCVIWENWTSVGGPFFGKSYNTYNPNLQRWEQYWVDNGAGVAFFTGHLVDGTMDYMTEDIPQPKGGVMRRHLQFFNISPDQVRQFCQHST
ncbi:MAG: hypothetical protein ACRD5L_02620, partial [Bryobacteraceae bacterium]